MALQKTKNLANGTSGNYWRIYTASFNRETLAVECTLKLYLDKTHADAGATSLGEIKSFKFSVSPSDLTGDIRVLVYTKILTYANSMIVPPFSPAGTAAQLADADLAGATNV